MRKGGCNFRRSPSARILIGTGGESGDCCRPPRGICPPDLTFWRNVAKLRFACFLCRAKCLFVCLFCTCLCFLSFQEMHTCFTGLCVCYRGEAGRERKMQKAMIGQNDGARAFFSFPSFSSRGFCRRGKCAHKCRTARCACPFFACPQKESNARIIQSIDWTV